MDKKKLPKNRESETLQGFEEFIEGQSTEAHFLPRGVGGGSKKNDSGFEHLTFLSNDSRRLSKIKNLLGQRLPFSSRFEQGPKLINDQKVELSLLKKKIFEISDKDNSGYRKSLSEIFDSYFGPTKN
jgi:hypothetical protein